MRLRCRLFTTILLLMTVSVSSYAEVRIKSLSALEGSQQSFRLISEDLGSALSYRSLAPAENLGLVGFDLGVQLSASEIKNTDILDDIVEDGDMLSILPIPRLYAQKGLPFGVDIGATYTAIPYSNIKMIGAEVKYTFLEGNLLLPSLAIRGNYATMLGVDVLDMDAKGLEFSVSKGFANLTPYAGLGRVWINSTPTEFEVELKPEEASLGKYFAGVNINFLLFDLALEADMIGENTTYSGKLGFRF